MFYPYSSNNNNHHLQRILQHRKSLTSVPDEWVFSFRERLSFCASNLLCWFSRLVTKYKLELLTCVSTTVGIIPTFFSCSPEYTAKLTVTSSPQAHSTLYHCFGGLSLPGLTLNFQAWLQSAALSSRSRGDLTAVRRLLCFHAWERWVLI